MSFENEEKLRRDEKMVTQWDHYEQMKQQAEDALPDPNEFTSYYEGEAWERVIRKGESILTYDEMNK